MRCRIVSLVCAALAMIGCVKTQAPPSPNIRELVDQLRDPRAIKSDTESRILKTVQGDHNAREYVVASLPAIIDSPPSDSWILAVRIAGELKAQETIPALLRAMSRRPIVPAEPYIDFAGLAHLDGDLVSKSLAKIGEPTVSPVTELLEDSDVLTRSRAASILRNIGSPAALAALRTRLKDETDPEMKELIQESLKK